MALCQRCLSAAAVLFCQAHNARLCRQCDYDLHPDGSQEVAHTRVQICQSCQTNGAAIFCIQCRRDNWPAVLCVQCDARIHGNAEDSSAMLHDRVSLEDAVGHFRAHGALPIAAAGLRRILNPLLQQHLFATCSNQMFQTTYNAPFVHGVAVAPQGPSRSPSPGAGWSPAFEGRDVPASPYQKCSNLSPAPGAQHINGGAQYGNVGAQHAGDVPSTSADNGIRNIAPSLHPLPPSPPKSSSEDTNDSGDGGTHHMLEFLGNNEEKQYEDDLVRLFLGACNTAEAGPPLLNQSQETRLARLMRYKDKRKSRRFNATVRYVGRKLYADTRPRVKGRFISREAAAAAATAGSPSDTPSGDGGAAGNLDGSPHASPSASSPEE